MATATGEIDNLANGLEKAQIDDTNNNTQDLEQESDPEPIIEKWQPIVDALDAATKDAFPASPAFDPSSPSTFQTYWRGVFTRLRDSVVSDAEISHHLTKPPVSRFTVTLFDNMHVLGCPCCQSYSEPAVVLENEDGVTKEELLNGIIDKVYGEVLPKVFIEEDPMLETDQTEVEEEDEDEEEDEEEVERPDSETFSNDSGVLMYTYSWMSCGNNAEGERVAYSDEPDIVLYCCRPDEYEKRTTRREDAEDAEGKA
ncbi:hypothetical protein ACHAPT_012598 [Fusarium lateritium]